MEQRTAFIDENWDAIVEDLRTLVSIPSVSVPEEAQEGAPFGVEARRAVDAFAGIARRMGFDAGADVADGYFGVCEIPGKSGETLGVIGHVDVVPAGPGWTVEPFGLTEREGFLLGRGVADDKGPLLLALWALKYCADRFGAGEGGILPHAVRFIIGSSEENGMLDIPRIRELYDDPDFLFTPDAEFPVCHGEKGMFGVKLSLAPSARAAWSEAAAAQSLSIIELHAGTVPNAVPGTAFARIVRDGVEQRLDVQGVSAHASTPQKGRSALKEIAAQLLGDEAIAGDERRLLELIALMAEDFAGASLGITAEDAFFGELTGVAGTCDIDEDSFSLTYDVRFPTSITGAQLEERVSAALAPWNDLVDVEFIKCVDPFLIDDGSAPVQALLGAFNEVTGMDAEPFTMGGATYARMFKNACSFGAEMPWIEFPEWAGGMHGPNEGVSIAQMRQALEIYIVAFEKLFEIELDSSRALSRDV